MSVYIKGVTVPSDDTITLRIYPAPNGEEHFVEQIAIDDDTLDTFWAITVPDHGRLIDADALLCLYDPHDYGLDGEQADEYDRYHVSLPVIRQNIDDMPTIIPADIEWQMKNCCCNWPTDEQFGKSKQLTDNEDGE